MTESNFTVSTQERNPDNVIGDYILEITTTSNRVQGVKLWLYLSIYCLHVSVFIYSSSVDQSAMTRRGWLCTAIECRGDN